MTEKSTIAGLISKAAKKLRDDFEHIRETISHSGEKGGETEDKVEDTELSMVMKVTRPEFEKWPATIE